MNARRIIPQRFRAAIVVLAALSGGAQTEALEFGDLFAKEKVNAVIWEFNEQYVRLVPIEKNSPPNQHPVALDALEVDQALASLKLWIEGGVLRNEESISVYSRKQVSMLANYIVQGLNKAAPDEDVTFNVRGYTNVLLSLGKVREWTSGRVFYHDGKLNLIVGEHRKRVDKAKKNVEGSFGMSDDFRDVYFDPGSRKSKGKMVGRIVTTEGVEPARVDRPDWVAIDVAKSALAYREAEVPATVRKEELKAKASAARLTLERRELRQEMARMRKELQSMQSAGTASVESLEERLTKLQQLKEKGLISDDDFTRRKEQILGEI